MWTTSRGAEFICLIRSDASSVNNNIENLSPTSCQESDWNRLFTYLKAQPLSPDIFTVQQISHDDQLATLTQRMRTSASCCTTG